jgi:hypothetical protein
VYNLLKYGFVINVGGGILIGIKLAGGAIPPTNFYSRPKKLSD